VRETPVKMRINMKQYPMVEVVWLDAEEKGEIGWNDTKELLRYAKKPCPTMRTVGYLVYMGAEHLALLSTIGPNECSTLEKIPLSFMKTLTYLQPIQIKDESDANL
jgi:hypothetical protein